MGAAEGINVVVSYKKQSGLGVSASGSGATGIAVLPSTGLAQQVATIESALLRRSLQRLRARQGSKTVTASYETELGLGVIDEIAQAVLGATSPLATFNLTESTLTSATITGTGTLVTMGGGDLLAAGVISGMMGKFTGLSVAGNNGIWFPILDPTATTFAIPTGILVDNTVDAAFTLTVAKSIATSTPYARTYYTVEEYLADIDISKLGTDMRFNSLQFTCAPDAVVKVGFGLAGRDLQKLDSASAPNFTSPTFASNPASLVMLDGAVYRQGTVVADLTGMTFGLTYQANQPKRLTSRIALDTFLGMANFAGNFTGFVQDGTAWDDFDAETPLSIFARFSEREADPADFISVYIGNAAYGGVNIPISDNALIQTLPLYAGEDARGAGYAASTMVVSTSAA